MPHDLPRWIPAWFWRIILTAWFCAVMMGFAAYNLAGLISNVTGAMIPIWAQLVAAVISGLMVRLGIHLEKRKRFQQ